jgi:hypothetical protein
MLGDLKHPSGFNSDSNIRVLQRVYRELGSVGPVLDGTFVLRT